MLKTLAMLFTFLFSAHSLAGFEEALEAYDNGDYNTAFREFKVLAEQG